MPVPRNALEWEEYFQQKKATKSEANRCCPEVFKIDGKPYRIEETAPIFRGTAKAWPEAAQVGFGDKGRFLPCEKEIHLWTADGNCHYRTDLGHRY